MPNNKNQVDGHAYFIRKPSSFLEVMKSTLSKHFHLFNKPQPYSLVKIIELSSADYNDFLDNKMLHDQDFLQRNTESCYVNEYGIWQALKVVNMDNPNEAILVQTEGANYARYIALEEYYPEMLKDKISHIESLNKPFPYKGHNWFEGEIGGYTVYAKVYPEPSQYGIENGRISKLTITDGDGNTIANYDRGWDVAPKEEYKDLYDNVVGSLEKQRQHISKEKQNRNKEYER